MIEAVTFDLWNTLFSNVSYSTERFNYLIEKLESEAILFNEEDLKKVFDKIFSFANWYRESLASKHIYTASRFEEMLKQVNIQLKPEIFDEIIMNFESTMLTIKPPLKNNVRETLENLVPDYKIGIISDTGITPGRIIRKVLEEYQLLKFFEVTLFSDETGIYKPHLSVFQLALNKLGVKPQNVAHVGDLILTDIKGAKESNITSIWINDRNQSTPSDIVPDFEIYDLYEVVDIVRTKLS